MKKTIILLACAFYISAQLTAQWNDSGSNLTTNDNVGIANINPLRKLHVGNGSDLSAIGRFSGTWNTKFQKHSRLELNDRNFGIGAGKITSGENGKDDDLYLWSYNGNGRDIRFMSTSNGETDPSTWATNMIIDGTKGYVGIANINPLRKLHVGNGSDLSAIGRFSGTWNTKFQKHSRLELNDRNFGIGAGKITSGENGKDDDL